MLIYRIENSKGIGPYSSGIIGIACSIDMFSGIHCPGPFTDGIDFSDNNYPSQDYYYGFQSMWHLRRWFNKQSREEIVEESLTEDYYCSTYRIDPSLVKQGKKQVAFIRCKAKLVRKQLLSEI